MTLEASAQRTFGDYQDIASTSTSQSYLLRLATLGALSGTSLASFLSADVPRSVVQATIGFPLPFLSSSLSASLANVTPVGSPSTRVLGVSWSKNFDFGGALSASVYASSRATRARSAPFSASACRSDRSATARSAAFRTAASTRRPSASSSRSTSSPARSAGGSRIRRARSSTAPPRPPIGRPIGVLTGRVNQSNGQLDGSPQMDGGLAVTGDGVFASNRIDDAFGVVKAGAPNVDVYVENQMVGHTDSQGALLVPNLRSFEPNRVAIDPAGLPVDAMPARTEAIVTPRGQSGVRVDFGVDAHVRAAELVLVDDHGAPLKAGRRGRLSNGAEFIVGFDGLAFVTGLGDFERLVIDGEHGPCRAEFAYRPKPGRRVRIGPVVCR